MTDHLRLDFTGDKKQKFGPTDWLEFILEVNGLCEVGGALKIFGDPEIRPAGANPAALPYAELYPEARVELDDDGRSTARVIATSEHAASVFRIAAGRLGLTPVELPADDVVERVIALWARLNAWIPAAARGELAEALGIPVERLITPGQLGKGPEIGIG